MASSLPHEGQKLSRAQRITSFSLRNGHTIWILVWIIVIPFAIISFYPRSADKKTEYLKTKINDATEKDKLEYLKQLGTGQVIEVPENIGLSYYTITPKGVQENAEKVEEYYNKIVVPFSSGDNSEVITDSSIYYFKPTSNQWAQYDDSLKKTDDKYFIGAGKDAVYFLEKSGGKYTINTFYSDGVDKSQNIDKTVFNQFEHGDAGVFTSPVFNSRADDRVRDYLYYETFDSLVYYPVDDLSEKKELPTDLADRSYLFRVIDGRLFATERLFNDSREDYLTVSNFKYLDGETNSLKPVFSGRNIPKEFQKKFVRGELRFYGTGTGIQLLSREKSRFISLEKEYNDSTKIKTNEINIPLEISEQLTNNDDYKFLSNDLFEVLFEDGFFTHTLLYKKTKGGADLVYDSQIDSRYKYRMGDFIGKDKYWLLLMNATGDYAVREIKNGETHLYELPEGYNSFYLAPVPSPDEVNVIGAIGKGIAHASLTLDYKTGKFKDVLLDEHIYWVFSPFSAEYNYNPVSIVLLTALALLLFFLGYIPLVEYARREEEDEEGLFSHNHIPSLKEKFYDIRKTVNRLQRNSRLMLTAGIGLASVGIVVFIIMITEQTNKITDLSDHISWTQGLLIARTSVLFFFIETVSFFFLRQYRVLFNEYKDFYALYLNIQRVFHLLDMARGNAAEGTALELNKDQIEEINKILAKEKFSFQQIATDNSVIDPEFVSVLSELRATLDGIKEKIKP